MKKFLRIGIPVAAVLIIAVVCLVMFLGDGRESNELKVGYIPIADCAQLYVAVEKGYFEDEGLDVELVPLAGGAKILEALSAGSVDVGFSNVISLILSRYAGIKIVSITGGPIEDKEHVEHAILVRKDSHIKKPKDLEGKVIALNTRRNIDELFVRRYLEHHGVDVAKVQFLEIPFPKMESVLLTGDVDAIAAIEPFVTFAIQHGNASVVGYNYVELEDRVEISSYDVLEDWLQSHSKQAASFKRAINRATDFIHDHEDEVRKIIATYTHLDPVQAQQITLPTFGKSLSEKALDTRIAELVQLGWLEKPINASGLLRDPK